MALTLMSDRNMFLELLVETFSLIHFRDYVDTNWKRVLKTLFMLALTEHVYCTWNDLHEVISVSDYDCVASVCLRMSTTLW